MRRARRRVEEAFFFSLSLSLLHSLFLFFFFTFDFLSLSLLGRRHLSPFETPAEALFLSLSTPLSLSFPFFPLPLPASPHSQMTTSCASSCSAARSSVLNSCLILGPAAAPSHSESASSAMGFRRMVEPASEGMAPAAEAGAKEGDDDASDVEVELEEDGDEAE